MPKRDRPAQRGRLERLMFSFMGPPQLGDVNAPVPVLPARPVERCAKCGQSYDDHEVVRDPRLTYSRCPAPRADEGDATTGS